MRNLTFGNFVDPRTFEPGLWTLLAIRYASRGCRREHHVKYAMITRQSEGPDLTVVDFATFVDSLVSASGQQDEVYFRQVWRYCELEIERAQTTRLPRDFCQHRWPVKVCTTEEARELIEKVVKEREERRFFYRCAEEEQRRSMRKRWPDFVPGSNEAHDAHSA